MFSVNFIQWNKIVKRTGGNQQTQKKFNEKKLFVVDA